MRVRIRHSKLGKVRFTSHRDTARHWERALRKAGLRVATSGGFSPRPRLSFGLALPTGAESLAEYLDVEFADAIDVGDSDVVRRMDQALPVGYQVLAMAHHADAEPSLQSDVVACTWWIEVHADADVDAVVGTLLDAASVPLERERKGQRRVDDIRPSIEALAAGRPPWSGAGTWLESTLATAERGLRPTELIAALWPQRDPLDLVSRIVRTHQWIERGGTRREVLPAAVDAGPAVVAWA